MLGIFKRLWGKISEDTQDVIIVMPLFIACLLITLYLFELYKSWLHSQLGL